MHEWEILFIYTTMIKFYFNEVFFASTDVALPLTMLRFKNKNSHRIASKLNFKSCGNFKLINCFIIKYIFTLAGIHGYAIYTQTSFTAVA